MKKTIIKISSLIVAGVILTTSCSKTGPAGAAGSAGGTGATGPVLTGTVVGYVNLFDQYGELLPASAAGEVYLTSNTKPGWKDSTYVNSSGANTYSTTLTTGTYQFNLATKTGGFGNLQINSLNVVGGGTQYNTTPLQMAQIPTFSVSALTVTTSTSTTNPSVAASFTVSGGDIAKGKKAILFFGNSSSVSSNPSTYLGSTVITLSPTFSTSTTNISCETVLFPAGADSSSVIYFTAYPISYSNGASSYIDVTTGKTIYNNLGTQLSGTYSVTIP